MRDVHSVAKVCLLVTALVLLAAGPSLGKTINVMPGKSSGIAAALASANAGDVIQLGCGVYDEGVLEMPDGVTLTGVWGDPGCVIIRGSGQLPVFLMENVGPGTLVMNLTVTVDYSGGALETLRGAGAKLTNASPVFMNVIFSGLKGSYGGAVHCSEGSYPAFDHCTFENNYALAVGAAVACVGSTSPSFSFCLFEDNRAEATGGAVHSGSESTPVLTQCTIVEGDAAVGSGLSSWANPGMMLDLVIVANGVEGAAWTGDYASTPLISRSDLYGNEGGDWVGALAPDEGVDGNFSADPQFCGPANTASPYTLNASSPCAGQPGQNVGALDVGCDVVSSVPGSDALPVVSRLHTNYPNPFNPRTTIRFDIHQAGHVDLSVFDVSGRLVKRLVNRTMTAGGYDAVWEGRDAHGRTAAAGVYFFRLKTSDTIDTQRMTLIK